LRRAVLTIGGTVAGLAALFSFRTHSAIGVADPAPAPESVSASPSASVSPTGPAYPTASSLASPTTKPSAAKSTGTATKSPTMGESTAPASVAPSTTKASSAPASSAPTTKAPSTPPTTKAPTAPPTTPAASPKTYTGPDENTQYGDVQVQITVSAGKITSASDVIAPADNIGATAVSQLNSETVSASSASIQAVSGATYTSNGYIASLQSAVDQAGL
jgi:uncharacterized protein with FMN-binding domain